MIGSFWNLCRACPSMPVDKLHSEYRSTYRWHEFTGNARPEVVRRPPAPNPSQFVGATNEPPLPRRKKCPELAYKSHEFIIGSEYTDSRSNVNTRMARSEERGGTPSRRSKSEGPPVVPNGRAYPIATEIDGTSTKQAGESNGLFKKTITKLSTEYRLQFVWPNVRRIKGLESNKAATNEQPKKSLSMGAIKSNQQTLSQHPHHQKMMAAQPTVHKKRTTNQKEATLHELEPLVSDAEDKKPFEKQVTIVEKKIASRPFSQTFDQERLNHFITKKENFGFADEIDNKQQQQLQESILMNGSAPPHSKPNLDLWFKEVVELRKKAGEYKCRGWGIEIDPELYKKQKDLWEQVSKNSSLSALSLASTLHRPITKEEKDEENNKKSIPAEKTQKSRVPGQAYLIDNKNEISALPARFANIRHHLERTTGPDVEEGALLPSPTREKLMPAITKRESESQRGSPKKTAASRHGSPQKGSPQKGSPKKVLKTRSQSVGPEHESPKRQVRSASTAPTAKTSAYSGKKTPTSGTAPTTDRKARPYEGEDGRETAISISSASPQPAPEIPDEPIVKSPPEPTRVKSPEQIIMRSPDPVNWTVPLDTGKTFTVTQNVKDGESFSRPQSEIKASTPVEKPPPPPQSAPPELTEQNRMDGWKKNPHIGGTNDLTDTKTSLSSSSPTTTAIGRITSITVQPKAGGMGFGSSTGGIPATIRYESKAMPGKTLRCLDDGHFEVDYIGGNPSTTSPSPSSSLLLPSGVAGAGTLSTVTPSATATATTTASSSIIEDYPITTNPIGSSSSSGIQPTGPSSASVSGSVSGSASASVSGPGSASVSASTSSARTTAADVLEKARDRFDRFWGGNTAKEDKV